MKLMSTAVIMPESAGVAGTMETDSHSFNFDGFQSSPKKCQCHHEFHYQDSFLLTALAYLDSSIG